MSRPSILRDVSFLILGLSISVVPRMYKVRVDYQRTFLLAEGSLLPMGSCVKVSVPVCQAGPLLQAPCMLIAQGSLSWLHKAAFPHLLVAPQSSTSASCSCALLHFRYYSMFAPCDPAQINPTPPAGMCPWFYRSPHLGTLPWQMKALPCSHTLLISLLMSLSFPGALLPGWIAEAVLGATDSFLTPSTGSVREECIQKAKQHLKHYYL
jgi:hypothetical protein